MTEPQATLSLALEAARQGLDLAREQARQAGARRTPHGAGAAERPAADAEPATAAAALDVVQLGQALGGAKINAGVIRIVSGVSEEAIALGCRIDVRY